MPSSTYEHIKTLAAFFYRTRPRSILDVGVGNGKIGFVARDVLDVMAGKRFRREEWAVRIDGIEAFGDYIQQHQRALYDTLHIGDAFEVIDSLGSYDMVVLGDVLEHFEKTRGYELLDKCFAHAERHVAIFVPLGGGWEQGEVFGNPFESHRAVWELGDFEPFAETREVFDLPAGAYGAFLAGREDYLAFRMEQLAGIRPIEGSLDPVGS
jgi:hypothetical protein